MQHYAVVLDGIITVRVVHPLWQEALQEYRTATSSASDVVGLIHLRYLLPRISNEMMALAR